MTFFNKNKNKKTPEELNKEREAKISSTSNSLKLQILTLEKKRDSLLKKVLEAKFQRNICIPMFIVALFKIAKRCK